MKYILAILALSAASSSMIAYASPPSSPSVPSYASTVTYSTNSQSATSGGSLASGSVIGRGAVVQSASNYGTGFAQAGVTVSPRSSSSFTAGGSTGQSVNFGTVRGNAVGSSVGSVGTDYSSSANSATTAFNVKIKR